MPAMILFGTLVLDSVFVQAPFNNSKNNIFYRHIMFGKVAKSLPIG